MIVPINNELKTISKFDPFVTFFLNEPKVLFRYLEPNSEYVFFNKNYVVDKNGELVLPSYHLSFLFNLL